MSNKRIKCDICGKEKMDNLIKQLTTARTMMK